MSSARKLFDAFKASDGRIKIGALTGISVLVTAIALAVGVFPALAAAGPQLNADVPPSEINLGGGSGGCAFVNSDAANELHINNPMTGDFTDGTVSVTLQVNEDDTLFEFTVNTPGYGIYDVTVNGGRKSNHYDYDAASTISLTDEDLHAPTKGGANSPLYNLSHINFCYDALPPASVEGIKYHDNDTDGVFDSDGNEDFLGGWTITAFDSAGNPTSTTTANEDGSYSLDLGADVYTVCEKPPTNPDAKSTLPPAGTGYTWAWAQSEPVGNTLCQDFAGYLPAGYTVVGDVTEADFGNHYQVNVTCGPNAVVVPLGGLGADDDPRSEVTIPANCPSGTFTSSYDVGTSDDNETWSQFVVFGGDPNGDIEISQVIYWDEEPAIYKNGSGVNCTPGTAGCSLVVPTTLVRLTPGGTLQPVVFCSTLTGDGPNSTTWQCLDARAIAEGAPIPPNTDPLTDGYVQLTEWYRFIGDPPNFR